MTSAPDTPLVVPAAHGLVSLEQAAALARRALLDQYLGRAGGVLHLGAHLGQEAPDYAARGKPVVWVEALPDIHARLADRLAGFPNQRALCALLSDRDGESRAFHVSNNSEGVSSSLFEFGRYGGGDRSLWPELALAMVERRQLTTTRLDTLLAASGIAPANHDFWVADLQGAELLALKGGEEALRYCNALLAEVSTVDVYDGGVRWPELCAWLGERGLVPRWLPAARHDDVLFTRSVEPSVRRAFHSAHYKRHNDARLAHLDSLGLDLAGKSVLEVGAGIGDHTEFLRRRHCRVVATDARPENLEILQSRFAKDPNVRVAHLDLDHPTLDGGAFDIVYCYGVLYHLSRPDAALAWMARQCRGMLLLESCVSRGEMAEINRLEEPAADFTQAFHGMGCRPTRPWIWQALVRDWPHVYATRTQPRHEEFPLDWTGTRPASPLERAVFVASRACLDHLPSLAPGLPPRQTH